MSLQFLRDDCDDLIGYLPRLQALMVPSDSFRENEGGKPSKIAGSPAPWADRVANVVLDVHAGSRQVEARLLGETQGVFRPRGSSDANTLGALFAIPGLAESAVDATVSEVAITVNTWARRARLVLDEVKDSEESWSKVPGGLACPMCGGGLWLRHGWQYVTQPPAVCRRCVDEAGHAVEWATAEWLGLIETEMEAS